LGLCLLVDRRHADLEGFLAEVGRAPQARLGLVQLADLDLLARFEETTAVHPDQVGPVDPGRTAVRDDTAQSLGPVVPVDHADQVGQILAVDLLDGRALAPQTELLMVGVQENPNQLHQLGPAVFELRAVEARAVTVDPRLVDHLGADEEVAGLRHESDLADGQLAVGVDRQQTQVVEGVLREVDGLAGFPFALGDGHLGAEERHALVVRGVILFKDHVLRTVDVEAVKPRVALGRDHDDGVALVGQATDRLPLGVDLDRPAVERQVDLCSFDEPLGLLLGHDLPPVLAFVKPWFANLATSNIQITLVKEPAKQAHYAYFQFKSISYKHNFVKV